MKFSRKHLYISTVVFAVIFFTARIPYYSQKLVDEEGIFAYLFLNDVTKPHYHLLARIDGVEIMGLAGHPSLMYASIELLGKAFRLFADFSKFDAPTTSFILRTIFSLPMLSIFMAGLLYIHKKNNASFYYWFSLFAVVAVSPVLLLTSTELQIDASFGVLTLGLWVIGLLFVSTAQNISWRTKAGILLALTIFCSLGKNEWSLVLLVSLLTAGFFSVMCRHKIQNYRESLYILLLCVVGVILGGILSYLFDPINYTEGFDLMVSMSGKETLNHTRFYKWIGFTRNRWTYVSYLILMLLVTWQLISKKMLIRRTVEKFLILFLPLIGATFISLWGEYPEWAVTTFLAPLGIIVTMLWLVSVTVVYKDVQFLPDPVAIVIPIFATMLFAAYFLSTWNVTPRYFALPIVVSVFALLVVIPGETKVDKKIVGLMTVCIFLLNAVSFFNFDTYKRLVPVKKEYAVGCLPILSSGEGVFTRDDFLGSSMSREYFNMMSKEYNKLLCGQ